MKNHGDFIKISTDFLQFSQCFNYLCIVKLKTNEAFGIEQMSNEI